MFLVAIPLIAGAFRNGFAPAAALSAVMGVTADISFHFTTVDVGTLATAHLSMSVAAAAALLTAGARAGHVRVLAVLAESERRASSNAANLDQIIAASPVPTLTIDVDAADTPITLANPAVLRLLDRPEQEVVGSNTTTGLDDDDDARMPLGARLAEVADAGDDVDVDVDVATLQVESADGTRTVEVLMTRLWRTRRRPSCS